MKATPNALAIRWFLQGGDDVMDQIQVLMKDRVESLASNLERRCRGHVAKEDLIQCGYLGLVKSLRRYDPGTGNEYEPYAMKFARGEMLHHIRGDSLNIKIPGSIKEAGAKIARFEATFTHQNGRPPTIHEVADGLNMSLDRATNCKAILDRQKATSSLDDLANAVAVDICGVRGEERRSAAQELWDEIVQLRSEGKTPREIADEIDEPLESVILVIGSVDQEIQDTRDALHV